MKVYVIMVTSKDSGVSKISQEGYTSLESAHNFIVNLSDIPEKVSNWGFIGDKYIYDIVDISIT